MPVTAKATDDPRAIGYRQIIFNVDAPIHVRLRSAASDENITVSAILRE
jgi:hypothetical protein